MTKIFITLFSLISISSIAQKPVKNGTIYKEHPYITIINNNTDLLSKQDLTKWAESFADTVKFYNPMNYGSKPLNLEELKQHIDLFLNDWSDISFTKQKGSYPDAFEWANDGGFKVQSYWLQSQTNKKTGKIAKFNYIQMDEFNKNGKIVEEKFYYDPTSLIDASN